MRRALETISGAHWGGDRIKRKTGEGGRKGNQIRSKEKEGKTGGTFWSTRRKNQNSYTTPLMVKGWGSYQHSHKKGESLKGKKGDLQGRFEGRELGQKKKKMIRKRTHLPPGNKKRGRKGGRRAGLYWGHHEGINNKNTII